MIDALGVSVTQYDEHRGAVRLRRGPRCRSSGAVRLMVLHFVPAHRCVELLESLTGAAPSVGFVHGMLTHASGLLADADKRIAP